MKSQQGAQSRQTWSAQTTFGMEACVPRFFHVCWWERCYLLGSFCNTTLGRRSQAVARSVGVLQQLPKRFSVGCARGIAKRKQPTALASSNPYMPSCQPFSACLFRNKHAFWVAGGLPVC